MDALRVSLCIVGRIWRNLPIGGRVAEKFRLFVSNQQVAVFDPDLDSPFNEWRPRHVSQGFSWRAKSVSFRVPDGDMCLVEVLQGTDPTTLLGEPRRTIMAPFEVGKGSLTAVGSITEEINISVPGGVKYQLLFDLLPGGVDDDQPYDCAVRLKFVKHDDPVFEICKADDAMDTSLPIDLEAQPAS
ncbi:hypothetical protein E2F50_22730 [Rhizobium deserti]|uniref:Uncharacterized protein n=1 Tax=Rhizobium deserti TaxID=2547961 RepID=A0A4R5U627_9HYPH|nr:hypothetical protein E2F50_22730 [Rhizobium deserti]